MLNLWTFGESRDWISDRRARKEGRPEEGPRDLIPGGGRGYVGGGRIRLWRGVGGSFLGGWP